jgi:hypothetical protein
LDVVSPNCKVLNSVHNNHKNQKRQQCHEKEIKIKKYKNMRVREGLSFFLLDIYYYGTITR